MAIKKPNTRVISVTRTAIYNNLLAANDPPGATISNWLSTRLAADSSYVEALFSSATNVVNVNISTIDTPAVWVSKDQVISLLGVSASGFTENDLINVADNVDGLHVDFSFKTTVVAG